MTDPMTPSRDIARLIEIMARLRTPVTGCPWDLEQTFETIAPYTIEEAYEVADAIERGNLADLADELGDLLLQVVYHARMAEEQAAFSFGDVVAAVTAKMIRRHPHVFGSPEERAAGAAPGFWARIKAEEKALKEVSDRPGQTPDGRTISAAVSDPEGQTPDGPTNSAAVSDPPGQTPDGRTISAAVSDPEGQTPDGRANSAPVSDPEGQTPVSALDGVPATLPALTRAVKLQDKAARVGFDWPSLAPVFAKLKEETQELEESLLAASGSASRSRPDAAGPEAATKNAAIKEEYGDMLFVMANIARHLEIDPEAALRAANQKFVRRFRHIEARLAGQGRLPAQSTLEEMDRYWDEARAADKARD